MTEFQRSLARNLAAGLLTTFLLYLCYHPILSESTKGYTPFTLALLTTVCQLGFIMGFVFLPTRDTDPPLFKYLLAGARIALPVTFFSAFTGLLLFKWWGLGGGIVSGLWLSIALVRIFGPDKPVDDSYPMQNHSYEIIDYYSRGMRIPCGVIPPLALLGTFLFQWWGLGAGFVAGAMISALSHAMWGPQKPNLPSLTPTNVASPAPLAVNPDHPLQANPPPSESPNRLKFTGAINIPGKKPTDGITTRHSI